MMVALSGESFRFVDGIAVMACQAIANIVKTSLGPVGLDKVRSSLSFSQFVWASFLLCPYSPCRKCGPALQHFLSLCYVSHSIFRVSKVKHKASAHSRPSWF